MRINITGNICGPLHTKSLKMKVFINYHKASYWKQTYYILHNRAMTLAKDTPISLPIVNRPPVAPPRVYEDSMTFVGDMFHLGRWVRMWPTNSRNSQKVMAIHGLLIVGICKPLSKVTTVTPCLGLYSSPLLYDEFPNRILCSPLW